MKDQQLDATNYLGDVLQDKSRMSACVGDLAAISLFADDRQIRRVRYREKRKQDPRYGPPIWRLEEDR